MKLDWSTSNLAVEARKEGKLLGRSEGRVEGLNCALVVIDLLKKNTNVETIAKMSGMPIEKIRVVINIVKSRCLPVFAGSRKRFY